MNTLAESLGGLIDEVVEVKTVGGETTFVHVWTVGEDYLSGREVKKSYDHVGEEFHTYRTAGEGSRTVRVPFGSVTRVTDRSDIDVLLADEVEQRKRESHEKMRENVREISEDATAADNPAEDADE